MGTKAATTISVSLINNAAKDDSFSQTDYSWLNENGQLVGSLNVLGNDPGSAKLVGVSASLPSTQAQLTNGLDSYSVTLPGGGGTYQIKLGTNADGTIKFDASA